MLDRRMAEHEKLVQREWAAIDTQIAEACAQYGVRFNNGMPRKDKLIALAEHAAKVNEAEKGDEHD
jgi:hypothetical protein